MIEAAEKQSIVWRPTPKQTEFLACPAYEALYGGAAAGGKTESLVLGALRFVSEPSYRALLLRRTFPELNRDIVPLSHEYYPVAGGKYNVGDKVWKFPSGAAIEFGHVEGELDVHKFQGLEVQYLGFDELTSFTEKQYRYLGSRVRSSRGVPVRVRAATNPGGVGHDWVFKRFAPWLDKDFAVQAKPGEVLWYRNEDGEEAYGPRAPGMMSRVFFPARVQDNPHMIESDPGYLDRLRGLDRVTRAQLLDGNWLIKPAAGLYFRREWFHFVDVRPARSPIRIRRWDLASTQDGGDWTVGVLMSSRGDGQMLIEDVVRARLRPSGVEGLVKTTAKLDDKAGPTKIVMSQDPGQAGKAQTESYSHLLAGHNVRFERETGDKVTRAQPFSAQCEAGNVSLVSAPWNEPFLQCLEAFPEGNHDDDVDAASGCFAQIVLALPQANYLGGIRAMEKR